MKPILEVVIYTPQELNQASYVHTGLFELEQDGVIKCRIVFDVKKKGGRIDTQFGEVVHTMHTQPKTSFYKLIDHFNHRTISFAVDLYDAPWFFSSIALEKCDFIFKRNYDRKYIDPLEDKYKQKIFPMGLTFRLQSRNKHGMARFFSAMVISNLIVTFKGNKMKNNKLWGVLKASYLQWKSLNTACYINDFKNPTPQECTEPLNLVLFQTRCFPNYEDRDVKEIHEQRAELIYALKSELKSNFIGGFIPDSTSKKLYPHLITNLPTDSKNYLKLVKKASIGIYTRGLALSPAWKMAEYLSQGKCIVAEPITTELPVPLEHDKHLLNFNSKEDCLDLCKTLLNNPEKSREISLNARIYYENYVDPASNVNRIINLIYNNKKY